MSYILRYWNEKEKAYTYVHKNCLPYALKGAREIRATINQPVEIYVLKEVL